MSTLSPILEAGNVDVVFSGHVHNYQRSYPMTFLPRPHADGRLVGPKGEVDGEWKIDKGSGNGAITQPKGVIYIVSGGGGAGLYNPEQQTDPSTWQPFTHKYTADQHSFTIVDMDGKTFRLKQVAEDGTEVDAFTIAK
jgi:hypothetical protein